VHRERGLADARRAVDRDDVGDPPLVSSDHGHQPVQLRQLRPAAEVGDVVRQLAGGHALRRRLDGARRRAVEQHAAVRLLERVTGLDAQLVGEHPTHLLVRVERLGPPPAAVQGVDQPQPQRLPGGVRAHEVAQLGDQVARVVLPHLQVDPALGGTEPLVTEAGHHLAVEPGRLHAGERPAAPQGEGLAQQAQLLLGRPGGTRLAQQLAERPQVDPVRRDGELVATGRGLDDLVPEQAAQPGHVRVDGGSHPGRHPLGPDLLGQRVGGHRAPDRNHQRGQQHPHAAGRDDHRHAGVGHLPRP
jgi:hypothetical protein